MKIIFSSFKAICFLLAIALVGCDKAPQKELNLSNDPSAVKVFEKELQTTIKKVSISSGNESFKSILDVSNNNNPYNIQGIKHNEVLTYISNRVSTGESFCSLYEAASTNFKNNLDISCNALTNSAEISYPQLVNNGVFSPVLFTNLRNQQKISLAEYTVLTTTFATV